MTRHLTNFVSTAKASETVETAETLRPRYLTNFVTDGRTDNLQQTARQLTNFVTNTRDPFCWKATAAELDRSRGPVGLLASFFYYRTFDFGTLPPDVTLIMDSGAFSAWTLGKQITPADYAAWLKKWAGRYWFAFNLDVIGDEAGSYRQWMQLRDLGVNTVPVVHFGDQPDEVLARYLRQGDVPRVAISGGAMRAANRGQVLAWQAHVLRWLRDNAPETRTHGLGVHLASQLARLPWDTIDSSTYTMAWRFARLGLYRPKARRWKTVPLDGHTLPAKYGADVRHYGIDPGLVASSTPSSRPELIKLATRCEVLATVHYNARRGGTA